MDFGKILGRAWEITLRWKILWVLGFLAALGSGNWGGWGGGGVNFSYRFSGDDFGRFDWFHPGPEWIGVIVAVLAVAFLIGIVLWISSIIASGGLVAGVQQVEEEGSTSFSRAWRVGVARFWSLLIVRLLVAIVIIVPVLVLLAIFAAAAASAGVSLIWTRPEAIAGPAVAGLFCCFLPICCGVVIIGLFLSLILTYAERAIVLEGKGALQALGRAWQVLRENLGATLLLFLIFLGIGIAVGFATGIVLLIFAAPFVAFLVSGEPQAWWIAPICGGGLVVIVVGALINAIVTTFISAAWTLAYREMTAPKVMVAAPPAEGTPAA